MRGRDHDVIFLNSIRKLQSQFFSLHIRFMIRSVHTVLCVNIIQLHSHVVHPVVIPCWVILYPTLGSSDAAVYGGAMHRYHVVPPVVLQCWVNDIPPTLTFDPHEFFLCSAVLCFHEFSYHMSGTTLGDVFNL